MTQSLPGPKATLEIALVQTSLTTLAKDNNLAHQEMMVRDYLDTATVSPDLIVLPEMFNTGFHTKEVATFAEVDKQQSFRFMAMLARQSKATVVGTFAVKNRGFFYNRLYAVNNDGSFQQYDKRHLFSIGHEDKSFIPGTGKIIINIKGWHVAPFICYDLRFPVYSRNTLVDGLPNADVLLYCANWPAERLEVWQTLLAARAIENSTYSVGVNRTGFDAYHNTLYPGLSNAYTPYGIAIGPSSAAEMVIPISLSWLDLTLHRSDFPVHLDADSFRLD